MKTPTNARINDAGGTSVPGPREGPKFVQSKQRTLGRGGGFSWALASGWLCHVNPPIGFKKELETFPKAETANMKSTRVLYDFTGPNPSRFLATPPHLAEREQIPSGFPVHVVVKWKTNSRRRSLQNLKAEVFLHSTLVLVNVPRHRKAPVYFW